MMSVRSRTRIALINLASEDDDWPIVMVPLGLMYLSSALRRHFQDDIELRLFDMTLHRPEHGGLEEAGRFLVDFEPQIVCLRGFTTQASMFPRVASLAKSARKDALVIAGGPHASTLSPDLIACDHIDLVAPREGEELIVDLVQAWLDGRDLATVAGVVGAGGFPGRRGPERLLIADLDTIAHPDYSLLDLERYQGKLTMTGFSSRNRFTSLFTSRGCHYACTFCHDDFGKKVRYRSVTDVLAEMEFLIETRNVSEFHIVDDIFNADRDRALQFFDEVIRRRWDLSFAFPNGLRADIMDEEFIEMARAAGVYHWALAVESASPRIQKLIKKHNRLDKVRRAIDLSDRHGVFVCLFNMIGFPTETEEEMNRTIDFAIDAPAHMTMFFVATPFHGTELASQVAKLVPERPKISDDLGYAHFNHETEWFATMTPGELQHLVVEGYRRFYFEDLRRIDRMVELANWGHGIPEIANFVEVLVSAQGWSLADMPDRTLARHLSRLNRAAREQAPERCAHLPVLETP